MATKFPDGTESLKNLSPNPGVKLSRASSVVYLVSSGCLAAESLMTPWSAPL